MKGRKALLLKYFGPTKWTTLVVELLNLTDRERNSMMTKKKENVSYSSTIFFNNVNLVIRS